MRWTEAEANLAKNLPGYARRENQHRFGLQAEKSFENERHLLAQMGTGTGKSFVNIVTAHRRSVLTGKPSVISTGTKALQDQYATKDCPFVAEKVIPGLRHTVLKGRANYVCLAKVDESNDVLVKAAIDKAQGEEGFSGEIADTILEQDQYSLVSTTSDECPGKKECPFGDVCFAERAKQKAKESHVVIANHAVVAADLSVKEAQIMMGVPEDKVGGILPIFGGIVVDEGHEFADAVRSALGESVTGGSFGRLAKELKNFYNDRNATSKLEELVEKTFRDVATILRKRQDTRNKTFRLDEADLGYLSTGVVNVIDDLSAHLTKIKNIKIHGDDKAAQKRKRLEKRIQSLQTKLTFLITSEQDEMVRWVEEGEGRKGDSINWSPIEVDEFLRRNLWEKVPGLMTSATLALGDDFSFLAQGIGMDEYDAIDGGTPFNYKSQAMTFVPDLPSPSGKTQNEWRAAAIAMTKELVRASDGRALLLFTSRTGMEETYRAMLPMLKAMKLDVYKQGDLPNKTLAEKFASDERSVLFALKSFFTGVDIQGDSLRLVVLDKLPFPVPSDVVLSAQVELADKQARDFQSRGFNKITVPLMALLLMQIYGRLIRTVNDWGVVAVMDSRLYGKQSKYYGSKIMKLLPPAPVTAELDQVVNYLSKEAVSA